MNVERLVFVVFVVSSLYESGHGVTGWGLVAKLGDNRDTAYFGCHNGGGESDDASGTSEVVAGSGRMGSLWLRHGRTMAVPRGVSPGCCSESGSPIYVATPSKSWKDIHEETMPERRDDLVWIGNGLPLDEFINATVVVPHYGILNVGSKPITSTLSPSTFIYGKHATRVASILENEGVSTEIVTSWECISLHAARKLLWASCMWLLCHSSNPPRTVSSVHLEHPELESLVEELLPALEATMGSSCRMDLNATLDYLESYSLSIPNAIPSKTLAEDEVRDRNGVWLELRESFPQPVHESFLWRVGGFDLLNRAHEPRVTFENNRMSVNLTEVKLRLWGEKATTGRCRSIVVIGSGIIGSSVAYNLARRGLNVTVFDRQSANEFGMTTPASWAWINANRKSPPAYQWLNQMGMEGWRKDSAFMGLPTWNGALVQFNTTPEFLGDYAVEGPLSEHRLQQLEPRANFSYNDGPVYFFPDEGCVDPAAAVKLLRQKASRIGVRFLTDTNVINVARDANNNIIGILTQNTSDSRHTISTTYADVVIVAAGVGSSSVEFGGIPLLHSPGQIAMAKPSGSAPPQLRRILVDTIRRSHVLQRQDGTIVAGGGFLEVGGTPSTTADRSKSLLSGGSHLLDVAKLLAPAPVSNAKFKHVAQAVRPMPQDGLPVLGYVEPRLYTVVTHSGVTLAPILGALVTAELAEGIEFELLAPYRPSRFSRQ